MRTLAKPLPTLSDSDLKRFHSKYNRIEPIFCWVWLGKPGSCGYGFIKIGNRNVKAHRIAYMLHYGKDPSDFLVCHSCDNPICVNPYHLFLGTDQINSDDKVAKHRHTWFEGQKHPNAKLTDDNVREIRNLAAKGVPYRKLANRFNVTFSLIGHIVKRRSWIHIK